MDRDLCSKTFPLSALAGQERMVQALLLNAVCPEIGGVLLRGEKGTAKSTAARGLAELLPQVKAVAGCVLGCDPEGDLCPDCVRRVEDAPLHVQRRAPRFVNLPLGATEDRVAGSLDMERAVRFGRKAFQPGLLAEAHRGVLYVDEVNLLSDHLVDLVLDAAASGRHVLEREGISVSHPSRFVLVGTMNPEEGELRPQLLDRFGLCVEVAAPVDPEMRLEVLRRREAFDADRGAFCRDWTPAQVFLLKRLARAREALAGVVMSASLMRLCAELAAEANAAGHRAELVMRRTAKAIAALDARNEVSEGDVRLAAEMALPHRRRMAQPQEQPQDQPQDQPDASPDDQEQDRDERPEDGRENTPQDAGGNGSHGQGRAEPMPQSDADQDHRPEQSPQKPMEQVFAADDPFQVRPIEFRQDRRPRLGSGRRSRSRARGRSGSYVKSRQMDRPTDLALDATLRAAAPHQTHRARQGVAVAVERDDLRQRIREKRIGHVVVLVVDASGSMGAARRMGAAKGAALSLLLDAYQKRDKVGVVSFRSDSAQVLLPPTSSVERASVLLQDLPTGGRTPLAHGLSAAYELLDRELRKNPDALPLLVLISDGRANVSLHGGKPMTEAMELAEAIGEENRFRTLVVDAEDHGLIRFGMAGKIAERMKARLTDMEGLKAHGLAGAVREAMA